MTYNEYSLIANPIFAKYRNLSIITSLEKTAKELPFEALEYIISGNYTHFSSVWVKVCRIEHEERIKDMQIAF